MSWTSDEHEKGASPASGGVPVLTTSDIAGRLVAAVCTTEPNCVQLLAQFLTAPAEGDAIVAWLRLTRPGSTIVDPERALRLVGRDIALIDDLLSRQVDAVLHHPRLQRLEASWRGLRFLVDRIADYAVSGGSVKLRLLDVSWKALARDLERASDFDQSTLFRKVYEDEFGSPGGEPYGVLLGDYEVRHRPAPGHPVNDIDVLASVAQVAAASFAPFVVGAHPTLLALDSFRELEVPRDLSGTFDDPMYIRWNAFRKREDTRFVALTAPRVLMRAPHGPDATRRDGFTYSEDVTDPEGRQFLWGTAVYAFGAVLARSFSQYSWLADIRGAPTGRDGGGVVDDLPTYSFSTERAPLVRRSGTDVIVAERLEAELAGLGLVTLCHLGGEGESAFFAVPSVQLPKKFDTAAATANARLSSMLPYILCVSRVAHFVKMLGRNKVGSYASAADCEKDLQSWLAGYCTSPETSNAAQRARAPLAAARVEVREHPGKPGCYASVIHVKPHFQLDHVATSVRLVTEFAPVGAG